VCKKREGVGFVVSSNKISGKGAYTQMRIKNNTQRFEVFVRAKSESQAGWEGLLNDLYAGDCGADGYSW
jgi:hypothetical protein